MHTGFVRAAISLCEIVLLSCLNATRQSVPRRQLQSVQPFMLRDPGALKHPELLSVCLRYLLLPLCFYGLFAYADCVFALPAVLPA